MPTIHIEANKEEIADLVLMPGDPKRAEYIANNFLEDSKLINSLREEYGYTGFYKGKRVTIFSSGMGIPSMGIYSYELFSNYNVKAIIRIGSAGSYKENLKIGDLFLTQSSYSQSSYGKESLNYQEDIVESSLKLNNLIKQKADELNIKIEYGRVHTTEVFYNEEDYKEIVKKYNCDSVEMESFSLFINALKLNKQATSLLTITDSFITGEKLSPESREKELNNMIKLALESITLI